MTDIIINFKGKQFPVPTGFTAEDYVESLISAHPEAANAQLVKDGEKDGILAYTLKPMVGTKG